MTYTPEQIKQTVAKLRYMGAQYAVGQYARGGNGKHYLEETADIIEALAQQEQPANNGAVPNVSTVLEKLKAVLCDPEGIVCFNGSDGDRKEIQDALAMLAATNKHANNGGVPEPVFYAVDWPSVGVQIVPANNPNISKARELGIGLTPLYAAPQPPQSSQAERIAELEAALRNLVDALDVAFVSWQSTAHWDDQLEAAKKVLITAEKL